MYMLYQTLSILFQEATEVAIPIRYHFTRNRPLRVPKSTTPFAASLAPHPLTTICLWKGCLFELSVYKQQSAWSKLAVEIIK